MSTSDNMITTFSGLTAAVAKLQNGQQFIVGPDDVAPELVAQLGTSGLGLTPITITVTGSSSTDEQIVVSGTGEVFAGMEGSTITMTFAPLVSGTSDGAMTLNFVVVPTAATQIPLFGVCYLDRASISFTPNSEAKLYFMDLDCNIAIGGETMPVEVQIPAYPDPGYWVIETGESYSPMKGISSDLFKAISNELELTQYLPPALNPSGLLEYLTLNEIEFAFNPKTPAFAYSYFSVTYSDKWEILGPISIDSLTFNFKIAFADNEPSYVELIADFVLEESASVNLGAHFAPDNFYVWGQLQQGSTLSINTLFAKMGVTLPTGFPKVNVDSLGLTADISGKSFTFNIGLDLANAGILTLGRMSSSITVVVASPNTVTGNFTGTLIIDATTLFLAADYSQTGLLLTGKAENIQIGTITSYLGSKAEITDVPDHVNNLVLKSLTTAYDTSSRAFTFSCEGDFALAGNPVTAVVTIDIEKSSDGYTAEFSGSITIGKGAFDIIFSKDPKDTTLSASWSTDDPADYLQFGDIASAFGWDDMPALPEDLDLGLTDAEFYYDFTAGTLVLSAHSVHYGQILFASLTPTTGPNAGNRVFLFALDIPLNLQLSNLPLVGAEMPADAQLGVKDLQIIVTSAALATADVTALNTLITGTLKDRPLSPTELGKGLTFATNLQMGSGSQSIVIPLTSTGSGTKSAALPAPSASVPPAPADAPAASTPSLPVPAPAQLGAPAYQAGATWFNIEKSFGPVRFQRIGVQYQGGILSFLLDATLSLSTLSLSCDGLGVGSPLTSFSPTFHLDGIAIAFSSGPVTIDGGLLVVPKSQLPTGVDFEYTGEVAIQIAPWMISGVASYANVNSSPSFFLFAQVTGDFGGPPAFFITGFMGGFGYNSQLALPSVDKVSTFPFVAGLDNSAIFGASPTPMSVLNVLSGGGGTPAIVTPTVGESWLAAGVLFRSFELVFGRALAVVEFGQEFEIALLGLASTSLPQGATTSDAYAYIELQLEVIIKPDDGLFSACGSLTQSSFVITQDCHLTGGFAFCYWFGPNPHAGDFVVVIGGYHPAFVPPAWYPQVAPLGFNWQVDSDVTIKGGAYFALTPSAIMAGGYLEVLFQSGCIKAWFIAYANLLITWKPFHFVASIGISLGAAVRVDLLFTTVTISFELGATLDLWGPPTGGVVHIHLYIVSFSVGFGASEYGAAPPQLLWNEFQTLLPQSSTASPLVLGAQINRGLVRQGADGTWFVRSDELIFTTRTAVPATSFSFGTTGAPQPAPGVVAVAPPATIAIRPMAIASATSEHSVTLTFSDDPSSSDGFSTWTQAPQISSLPEALWGAPLPNGTTFAASSATIPGLPTGVQLIAPPAVVGNSPGAMDITSLVDPLGGGYAPLTPVTQADPYPAPTVDSGMIATITITLGSSTALSAQQSLIAALSALQAAPPTSAQLTQLAANAGQAFSQPPLLAA